MKWTTAAGGIFFLVVAALFVAEALFSSYSVSLDLQVPFVIVAIVSATCGIFLLQTARASIGDDLQDLPGTVEDPHHAARIRSTVFPNTTRHGAGTPIGDGGIYSEPEKIHEDADEHD